MLQHFANQSFQLFKDSNRMQYFLNSYAFGSKSKVWDTISLTPNISSYGRNLLELISSFLCLPVPSNQSESLARRNPCLYEVPKEQA